MEGAKEATGCDTRRRLQGKRPWIYFVMPFIGGAEPKNLNNPDFFTDRVIFDHDTITTWVVGG